MSHAIDRDCAADDFSEFVRRVVRTHPGWLSRYVRAWVGRKDEDGVRVGRFEKLIPDLVSILSQVEEPFCVTSLCGTKPLNQGHYKGSYPELPDSVALHLLAAESDLINRFYPQSHLHYDLLSAH